jgi:hypothetical protein
LWVKVVREIMTGLGRNDVQERRAKESMGRMQ